MSLRDELLTPIEGGNPSGEYLRYSEADNSYDKTRDARRQDSDDAGDLDEGERKRADFRRVIELASEALATKTKDLWLACWLAEALTWENGTPGLREGLEVLDGLLETFWDTLYPEIEGGDLEARSASLHWLGSYFEPTRDSSPRLALMRAALTADGLPWMHFKAARQIAYEKDCKEDKKKREAREQSLKKGEPSPEEVDQQVGATKRAFYEELGENLTISLDLVRKIDKFCTEKFDVEIAPSFSPLKEDLEGIKREVDKILPIKRAQEPDLVPEAEGAEAGDATEGDAAAAAPSGISLPLELQLEGGKPSGATEAIHQLVKLALHLMRVAPTNPVPYLVLRAIRWGELRANPEILDSMLLEAPPTEYRTKLRRQALSGNWQKVLETAEAAMAGTCGRGWLDLQRYAIRACEELGHHSVAKAIRSELLALLSDYPQLPDATLLDDTGAANPETLAWIRDGLASGGEGPDSPAG